MFTTTLPGSFGPRWLMYRPVPSSHVVKVRKEGLVPLQPAFDYDDSPRFPVVYLAMTPDVARSLCMKANRVAADRWQQTVKSWGLFAVLLDSVTNSEVFADTDWNVSGVYFITTPVPANRIRYMGEIKVS